MASSTKGRGRLVISISFREKSHADKLGYTVKSQEGVQSSNAVSSTCLFPKV